LRSILPKSSVLLCVFCGQKDSMPKIFINKCTVGSVCLIKRFTAGWQTFHWCRRRWNGRTKMAETRVKRLVCLGFWRIGKAMAQVVSVLVEDMSRNKCIFPGSNITCFTFYINSLPIYWRPSYLELFYWFLRYLTAHFIVRFEAARAVTMKYTIIWDVTPCIMVDYVTPIRK
jgi:hypothetical protein